MSNEKKGKKEQDECNEGNLLCAIHKIMCMNMKNINKDSLASRETTRTTK